MVDVRLKGRTPIRWQFGQTVLIPKHSLKPGIAGLRTINLLDGVGKCRFSQLWLQHPMESSPLSFGYEVGASREEAVLQTLLGLWYARQAGLTASLVCWDATNAFCSVLLPRSSRAEVRLAGPKESHQWKHRAEGAVMFYVDSFGRTIGLRPRHGVPQGDTDPGIGFEVYTTATQMRTLSTRRRAWTH
jgi:hypothetical protein